MRAAARVFGRYARALARLPGRLLGWKKVLFFQFVGEAKGGRADGEIVSLTSYDVKMPWDSALVNDRLRAGHALFALVVGGTPVCYGWVSDRNEMEIDELGGTVGGAATRWIWDCVTPLEHRRRGYYSAFLTGLVRRVGKGQPVIYCDARNVASRRAIEQSGFARVSSVVRTRFGTRVISHRKGTGIGFRRS